MADGNLAFSHISAQGGALICRRPLDVYGNSDSDAGALCFKKTRSYWHVEISCDFSSTDEENYPIADVITNIENYMLDTSWHAGSTGVTRCTGSGTRYNFEYITVKDGTEAPFGVGSHIWGFACACQTNRTDGVVAYKGNSQENTIPGWPGWGTDPSLKLCAEERSYLSASIIPPLTTGIGGTLVTVCPGWSLMMFESHYREYYQMAVTIMLSGPNHHPKCTH